MEKTVSVARRLQAGLRARGRCSGDRGANLIEYAFLLALIAIVCIAAVSVVGRNTCQNMSLNASAFGGVSHGAQEPDC